MLSMLAGAALIPLLQGIVVHMAATTSRQSDDGDDVPNAFLNAAQRSRSKDTAAGNRFGWQFTRSVYSVIS